MKNQMVFQNSLSNKGMFPLSPEDGRFLKSYFSCFKTVEIMIYADGMAYISTVFFSSLCVALHFTHNLKEKMLAL